jgi:hypothetical protein
VSLLKTTGKILFSYYYVGETQGSNQHIGEFGEFGDFDESGGLRGSKISTIPAYFYVGETRGFNREMDKINTLVSLVSLMKRES